MGYRHDPVNIIRGDYYDASRRISVTRGGTATHQGPLFVTLIGKFNFTIESSRMHICQDGCGEHMYAAVKTPKVLYNIEGATQFI